VRETISFLSDLGYEGFFLFGDNMVSADQFSVAEHQSLYCGRGYVSDFYFTSDASRLNRR
jgi:hypothetical protein